MIVNNWQKFKDELEAFFKEISKQQTIGLSICTINGQKLSLGCCSTNFQNNLITSVLNYGIALQENGIDIMNKYIGNIKCENLNNSLILNNQN